MSGTGHFEGALGFFKVLPRNSSASKFKGSFSKEKQCVPWGTFKGSCQGRACVMLRGSTSQGLL